MLALASEHLVVHPRAGAQPQRAQTRKWSGEREFFIDNLLVPIHLIIEMIWWTLSVPCFDPEPYTLTGRGTLLGVIGGAKFPDSARRGIQPSPQPSVPSFLLLSSTELSDTNVCEPQIRALRTLLDGLTDP